MGFRRNDVPTFIANQELFWAAILFLFMASEGWARTTYPFSVAGRSQDRNSSAECHGKSEHT
jgi:hypothetical protein